MSLPHLKPWRVPLAINPVSSKRIATTTRQKYVLLWVERGREGLGLKKLVSMLASVSVVFSSFGSNCYSCDFSRGFKSFSLWLTARSCSLYVE